MPKGYYQRRPRGQYVQRVSFTCEICGKTVEVLPSEVRTRTGRFCSKNCSAIAQKKPDRYIEVDCSYCGKRFSKRRDQLCENNYCSRECQSLARRKPDAKWRDPEYIRQYMRAYNQENKEKIRKRKKQYSKEHPEIHRRARRKWRKKNGTLAARKYRARKQELPADFTDGDWEYAVKYFNGCCAVCGEQSRDLLDTRYLSRDHWIPLSDERPDNPGTVPSNIVPLCQGEDGCNNSKGSRSPNDWLKEKYGQHQAQEIADRIQQFFETVRDTTNGRM